MTLFLLGLALFLGIHSISIVAPSWRDAQVAQRGDKAWKNLYSLASIATFALMVYGYSLARQAPVLLWAPPPGTRHVALLLMLPVFPLFASSYFQGRIFAAVKHPMLTAVKLWALAHVLANGTLHSLILFVAFLAWAVVDRISVKRRPNAKVLPGAAPSPTNDVKAVVAGLVVYAVFLMWGHRWLIGVSPLGGLR